MLRPALAMQYSPRLIETTVAEIDVMLTIAPLNDASAFFAATMSRAKSCVRKKTPRRFVFTT